MADINSFQDAGSFTTQTAPGAGYSTPAGQGGDWGAFFDLAAKRKAAAAAEEKRRYDQEFAMKQAAMEQAMTAGNKAQYDADAARSIASQGPRQEWVDTPAMKRLAFGVPSATTRVRDTSNAAQMTPLGVVGY